MKLIRKAILKWLLKDGLPIPLKIGDKTITIGTNIDMGGGKISNVGAPTTAGDVLVKGTRLTMAEMPDGPSGYVLIGQGAGVNPAYSPLPPAELYPHPGELTLIHNDAEKYVYNLSYAKTKEVRLMGLTGTLTTYFEIRSYDESTTFYARIYKNGSPLGTVRSTTSPVFIAFTEDLSFNSGDYYQIYTYNPGYIRNQRIINCGIAAQITLA